MAEVRIPAGVPAVRHWPEVVRQDLHRRAEQLQALAHGTVLDLASPAGQMLGRGIEQGSGGGRHGPEPELDPDPDPDPAIGMKYDTIVSVGALTIYADLLSVLDNVGAHLAPEGQFLFIEPVGRPGWRASLAASASSQLSAVRGQHLNRDVPSAIRAGGLTICAIDRYDVATTMWPLRHFVQGRAVRFEGPVSTTESGKILR